MVSLVTRNFVVGGNRRLVHTAKQYHFGVSEHLDWDHVNETVIDLFHIPDGTKTGSQNKYRDIVLVGHGLRSDLLILRQRGILFEEISTIVAKFDTSYIAKDLLGLSFDLQKLLNFLHCPNKYLHNAGNDANFTLRALLLLTYYGLRSSTASPEAIRNLNHFKILGLETLPDTELRNAKIHAFKFQCDDSTLNALDLGGISFFEDC